MTKEAKLNIEVRSRILKYSLFIEGSISKLETELHQKTLK